MKNAVQCKLQTVNESMSVQRPAVCVRCAFKRYDSGGKAIKVLTSLNMTVTKGTIYGLLGYEESGKTTLLSCILGCRRLNSGKVWILGNELGTVGSSMLSTRIGYMPQQIALYKELSIKETIMYSGGILGLNNKKIERQLFLMLSALDLPNQNCVIRNLSRGQQRRVSFVVALLHDPELLILDEPMTEIDPLLRRCLWHYLKKSMRSNIKTIIFSTRNFDDARHANTVGIMYNGRICVEDSPQALLTNFNCASLERLFTNLSKEQTENKLSNINPEFSVSDITEPQIDTNNSNIKSVISLLNSDWPMDGDDGSYNKYLIVKTRHKVSTLLKKNLLRLRRNFITLVLIYTASIIQVVLFCLSVGRDPTGLKLAVVNEEMNFTSRECPITKGCTFKYLSCRYLAYLNNKTIIDINYYPDLGTALDSVRTGNSWGALHFEKNFTDAFIANRIPRLITDEKILNDSEIKIWLDMSNQPNALELNWSLEKAFRDFSQDLWSTCIRLNFQKSPIRYKEDMKSLSLEYIKKKFKPTIVTIVNIETNQTSKECPKSQDCVFAKLSCRYLSYLYKAFGDMLIVTWNYAFIDTALKSLEDGNVKGVFYISNNFTNAIAAHWQNGRSAKDVFDMNEPPEVSFLCSISDDLLPRSRAVLKYAYNKFIQELWESCGNETKNQSNAYRSERDYPVGFTDKNNNNRKITSEAKLAIINGDPTKGECSITEECSFKTLSCQYITYLRTSGVTVKQFKDVLGALYALWRRQVTSVVYIRENFINTQAVFWMFDIRNSLEWEYWDVDRKAQSIWFDILNIYPNDDINFWKDSFILKNLNNFLNHFMIHCDELLNTITENAPIRRKLYYVPQKNSNVSETLIVVNDELGYFTDKNCPYEDECKFAFLSCRYLRYIKPAFDIRIKPDIDTAKKLSTTTRVGGILHFKQNFTTALVERWILGSTDNETVNQSTIDFWEDNRSSFHIKYICLDCSSGATFNAYRVLYVAYSMFLNDVWESCKNESKTLQIPIFKLKDSLFDTNDSFMEFVAPGFILLFIHSSAAALMRSEVIIEKGVFDRSLVIGLPTAAILFSLVVVQSLIMCGQTAVVLIIMFLAFGITCRGNIATVIALTLLQGLCGICFGLAAAIVFKSERRSLLSIVVSLSLTLIVGGVIWPTEGMPSVLNYMSRCLPLTQATASLRAVLTRGTAVTDPEVYFGFTATVTWIVLFSSISVTVSKFSKNHVY